MKKKNIENLISFVLVFMLCVGAFGLFSQFFDGVSDELSEGYSSFYLTHEEKSIYCDTAMTFKINKEYRFDVNYTSSFSEVDEDIDYNVKIVSNAKNNAFQFTVNGANHVYLDGLDLSKAFSLEKYDTFFVFRISDELNLETILQTVYEGKTVTAPLMSSFTNPYLFTLVVSSYDENFVYNIDFTFVNIEDFSLNNDVVVF